jgi:hypothetical protein
MTRKATCRKQVVIHFAPVLESESTKIKIKMDPGLRRDDGAEY